MGFGEQIQGELDECRRSQRWLAKITGLNHVTVCRIIADKQKPEFESVCKIIGALPVDQGRRFMLFAVAGYMPPELTEIFCQHPRRAAEALLNLSPKQANKRPRIVSIKGRGWIRKWE